MYNILIPDHIYDDINIEKRILGEDFNIRYYSASAGIDVISQQELSKADVIYVTRIYGAGEENEDKINSKIITDLIYKQNKNVSYINNYHEITEKFYELTQKGDLILNMGAGDCHNFWSILNTKKIKSFD